ncbi:MAG: serine/threonine protein kinase [Deltaproteobacteria bacterium]|nr:serine/threonine protein kinase [Deltaproteobacteria bacterium]
MESRSSTGRLVGRYVVHDRIAAGGMATVHIGRLLGAAGFSRTVAVKRLHDAYAQDPEFVAMLLDEARLAAVIRHPNVVPTVDVVAEQDELLVVMEYVEGDSVAHLHKIVQADGDRIPIPFAASIVAQALHGLHAAHEARDKNGEPLGIVHRDVSPQNILVGTDGVARVLDFGIAKAASRATSTGEGEIKGKTAYMAPEQLHRGAVDRRTDIFAAGVVLWELLTAQRLFFADSPAEVMSRVLSLPIDPPEKHTPALPSALSAVVMRALDRDPANRFASAEEMALAIEDAVPMPRAKEIGAWVSKTAKLVLEGRAALVHQVETSSHRMPAAKATDSALAKAIEEAERRRFEHDMPTDAGVRVAPTPAPSSAPAPRVALPASVTGEEGTGLATVQSTNHAMVQPSPARSRTKTLVALAALASVGAAAIVAVSFTRAPAPGGGAAAKPPPAPEVSSSPVSTEPPLPAGDAGSTASTPPERSGAKAPSKPPIANGKPPKPPLTTATPPATGKRLVCDPPFDIDANGNKHFKPECL